MMNKKNGQIHVEMILSFILFVGAVFFIFFFLNPLKSNTNVYTDLDNSYREILKNVSIEYRYISLALASNANTCFTVANPFREKENLIVQDSSGNILASSINSSFIKIAPSGKFYRIYFSDYFNHSDSSSLTSCPDISAQSSFGPLGFQNEVLYENLIKLDQEYSSDYNSLKSDLNLNNDFEFVVYDENHEVLINNSLSLHKLKPSNVYSREIPLEVIYPNASQNFIILNLRVWK
jgi:hypothetical protein